MIHLDGKVLQWHKRIIKTKGLVKEMKWDTYVTEMRTIFQDKEFTDPMSDLVSLKKSISVDEFCEKFEDLLNLLHLFEGYALSIFVSNLQPKISKSVRLFHPKNLTYALNLAKQIKAIIYNPSSKPFTLYSKSTYTNYFYHNTKHQPNHTPFIFPKHYKGCCIHQNSILHYIVTK